MCAYTVAVNRRCEVSGVAVAMTVLVEPATGHELKVHGQTHRNDGLGNGWLRCRQPLQYAVSGVRVCVVVSASHCAAVSEAPPLAAVEKVSYCTLEDGRGSTI
eukprot:s3487_g2.t1